MATRSPVESKKLTYAQGASAELVAAAAIAVADVYGLPVSPPPFSGGCVV